MKLKKRIISLVLALIMIVGMSVSAFAITPGNAAVTVYITEGKFSKGGIDSNGNLIFQTYTGGASSGYVRKVEINTSNIDAAQLTSLKLSYGNPNTGDSDINVLDAIAYALSSNSLNYSGGWDAWSTPNGGYISTVSGFSGNSSVEMVEIGNREYTKYSGFGWNIAFDRGNGFEVPAYYGTSYSVEDGMVIVFDYSEYELYY